MSRPLDMILIFRMCRVTTRTKDLSEDTWRDVIGWRIPYTLAVNGKAVKCETLYLQPYAEIRSRAGFTKSFGLFRITAPFESAWCWACDALFLPKRHRTGLRECGMMP